MPKRILKLKHSIVAVPFSHKSWVIWDILYANESVMDRYTTSRHRVAGIINKSVRIWIFLLNLSIVG